MCGRYGFGNPARFDALAFGVALPPLIARYNIAPSTLVPLVCETRRARGAGFARWGLVPSWADDPSIGNRLINARGDTAATKPTFREAFARRRGLLPADLFYEWQAVAGARVKQPWCIRDADNAPFAFGALWDTWKPKGEPDADALVTCTILTTEPNEVVAPIHDRMPVIIAPADYDAWLDPRTALDTAQSLVRPYAGALQAWRVGIHVNTPAHDDVACIAPLTADAPRN